MVHKLEISSFEDLISIIPDNLRVKDGILGLDKGISEHELNVYIDSLSNDKDALNNALCFSGGGV